MLWNLIGAVSGISLLDRHIHCFGTVGVVVLLHHCCRLGIQRVVCPSLDSILGEQLQHARDDVLESVLRSENAVGASATLRISERVTNGAIAEPNIWVPDRIQDFHCWRRVWPRLAAITPSEAELDTDGGSREGASNS